MMKNRLFALVLALVMALSLFGCGQKPAADDTGDAPETVTVTDMIGRELELTPGSYQRVVCIGAGALRLYSYVGDVSLLCGVEDIDNTTLSERPQMFDGVARPYVMVYGDTFAALPSCGVGGPNAQAAEAVLRYNGVSGVRIEYVSGKLTDHFDPRSNVIRLSSAVYSSTSVASIGVAAHEAGHAVQYAVGYGPVKLRSAIVKTTQFSAQASFIILMLGLVLYSQPILLLGIVLFGVVAFFQLVTLPVEFNASHRALETLEGEHILEDEEMAGARKVLRAAALTYVAALLSSLLQLLRYVLIFLNRSGNRRGGRR